jgi:DNA-binding response OmpR family regulator
MSDADLAVREQASSGLAQAILVIESDADLGGALVEQLVADDHPAELALTAGHAGAVAGMRPPKLVVLGELDSPRGALELLEKIRGRDAQASRESPWQEGIPVIVVSSRTQEPDLLRAFDAGADDFIARPARYLELRARLRALLRRTDRTPNAGPLRIGPLAIDTSKYAASLHGDHLQLRRLEYELLLHLAGDPRRVFRKQELLQAVWGHQTAVSTRTLDSHASRLRRKLTASGERWIVNVRGIGYRLI